MTFFNQWVDKKAIKIILCCINNTVIQGLLSGYTITQNFFYYTELVHDSCISGEKQRETSDRREQTRFRSVFPLTFTFRLACLWTSPKKLTDVFCDSLHNYWQQRITNLHTLSRSAFPKSVAANYHKLKGSSYICKLLNGRFWETHRGIRATERGNVLIFSISYTCRHLEPRVSRKKNHLLHEM